MPDAAPAAAPRRPRRVRETLGGAVRRLRAAGIASRRLDAELLLAQALGTTRPRLLTHGERSVPAPAALRFEAHLRRRLAREPVSRILGRREFWSIELEVAPAVLDPRPDSETLVAAVLAALPARDAPLAIADLGTGSGCLLVALLSELPGAFAVGVDRDPAALAVARRNARRAGLAGRAAFVAADWGAALAARFDIVVCNPPYLATRELAAAPPELRHDPRPALDGGADGLDAYRALAGGLTSCLAAQGRAFLEIGAGRAAPVAGLLAAAGLAVEDVVTDLAGRDRCLVAASPRRTERRESRHCGKKRVGLGAQPD